MKELKYRKVDMMNNEDYLNSEELRKVEELTERMVKNATEEEIKRCITEITVIKERARLRILEKQGKAVE
ncbi:hypothetical protein BTR23_21250 [Alkalihalophilus pseudofirmus]|uniref:hypothetical protein n=1 Tax=Alkalihalobacterium alkalinitrilicum TaxID=427920 RepID=UPI00094DD73B|nr:hypothetical protein [Alkalihalobacterium alkalinitrilicum]OLO27061.1 hypothetical protein BTR23_21250 [Alkalihalophilus pseudofirmus]